MIGLILKEKLSAVDFLKLRKATGVYCSTFFKKSVLKLSNVPYDIMDICDLLAF